MKDNKSHQYCISESPDLEVSTDFLVRQQQPLFIVDVDQKRSGFGFVQRHLQWPDCAQMSGFSSVQRHLQRPD